MSAPTYEVDVARYRLAVPAFHLDADPDVSWACLGFDEPWNGWCAPIVDWETVFDVLQEAEWMVRTEGAMIYAASDPDATGDEIVALQPDDRGLYHLRDLGWTFVANTVSEAKVLAFERQYPKA
jgi:hypothetical protein